MQLPHKPIDSITRKLVDGNLEYVNSTSDDKLIEVPIQVWYTGRPNKNAPVAFCHSELL